MRILISNADTAPIYDQIMRQIREQIINESLQAGDPLPSIRKLARELQVSVITTKRAYDDLEKEGFIDTVPGKGCFVASSNREFMKEKQLKIIESKIEEAVNTAMLYGVEQETVHDMVRLLFGKEENNEDS